jgi:hypothetical protein
VCIVGANVSDHSSSSGADQRAYLARVTTRDHRAIEEALAGATLLTESSRLAGVVIEAAYAAGDPPLLKRLREDALHGSSTRKASDSLARFLEVDALSTLPYAPKAPLVLDDLPESRTRSLAREAMEFEQHVGCDLYVAPGLPLYDADLEGWLAANDAILGAACAANGGADLDRKPLLALVAPGTKRWPDPATSSVISSTIPSTASTSRHSGSTRPVTASRSSRGSSSLVTPSKPLVCR